MTDVAIPGAPADFLTDYDWDNAFGFTADSRPAVPGDSISLERFSRADVKYVAAYSEGYNDGDNWLMFGETQDGRWFLLSAWCDYTGWD